MKISFESQLLQEKEKTGIAWVADSLLKELIKDNEHEYYLNYFLLKNKYNLYQPYMDRYEDMGFRLRRCKWFSYAVYKMLWSFVPIPYSSFFGKDTDITVFFNYYIPPGVKGKKITFIHDMAYKVYPETVRKKTKIILDLNVERSCKTADRIITISEFSKSEIIKHLNVPEEKITVMPCGVDRERFYYDGSDYSRKVAENYGIKRDYFLYLGTLEPRKNITRIVSAYAKLKEENGVVPLLVLAGRKGWMYDEIFDIVKQLNLDNDVIFTDYVKNEDVPWLMREAKVFLFPSLYEGFGLPPLEAMACGTPVITSKVSSLPEVVGDAGILVDPYSVDEIKDAMYKYMSDNEFYKESVLKGLKRGELFTWKKSSDIIKKVFEELEN